MNATAMRAIGHRNPARRFLRYSDRIAAAAARRAFSTPSSTCTRQSCRRSRRRRCRLVRCEVRLFALRRSGECFFHHRGSDDNAATRPVDARAARAAAVVEYAHHVAVHDAALGGIGAKCISRRGSRSRSRKRCMFAKEELRKLRAGGRETKGDTCPPLRRRVIEGQRVDALLRQPLAVELALARGRKPPCANGAKRCGTSRRCQPSRFRLSHDAPLSAVRQRSSSESRSRARRTPCAPQGGTPPSWAATPPPVRSPGCWPPHVKVAVGLVHVVVLELRRRRQQDVGVVRGIGLEMIHHHGEEVLARKPGDDFLRVGHTATGLLLYTIVMRTGGLRAR